MEDVHIQSVLLSAEEIKNVEKLAVSWQLNNFLLECTICLHILFYSSSTSFPAKIFVGSHWRCLIVVKRKVLFFLFSPLTYIVMYARN